MKPGALCFVLCQQPKDYHNNLLGNLPSYTSENRRQTFTFLISRGEAVDNIFDIRKRSTYSLPDLRLFRFNDFLFRG